MPTTLQFHERMEGFFAAGVKDPVAAANAGKNQGTNFAFEVTIQTEDLDRFIADPRHTARVTGFYQGNFGPLAGKDYVTVKEGIFNFMSPGPGQQKLMEHHHLFEVDGKRYRLDGAKHLENEPGTWDEWYDLTTLFTTISEMGNEPFDPYAPLDESKVIAAGITRFPAKDTLKLLRSFEVHGTDDPWAAKLKFLRLFLGSEAKVLLSAFQPYNEKNVRRRLSAPKSALVPNWDVVVIGSGYGGGVAAARLSAPGKKSVCILERGREYRAGGFPDEWWEVPDALRSDENPLGLFDFRVDPHIKALVGNGLGGTSLINASVMLRPDPGVMTGAPWPAALPDLAPYYDRAEKVLGAQPHPAPPLKSFAFRRAAEAAGKGVYDTGLVPIAVAFEELARPDADVVHSPCTGCGSCVTGCNFQAKGSTDMNYVAIAEKQGAKVFTCIEVRTIEPLAGGGFRVHAFDHELQKPVTLTASQVVLAAGTYGSFGVLARSRDAHGLKVSPKLGAGFSGNGDVLGFGYNTALSTQISEGPTITSIARYGRDEAPRHRLIIEEGGVPRAMIPLFRTALPATRIFTGVDTAHGAWNAVKGFFRAAGDVIGIEQNGAMNHTFMFFAMGFEENSGWLRLVDGNVTVDWPNVANEEFAKRADERMLAITAAAKGVYVDNPLSRQFLGDSLITAHPIGGCAMADDENGGVVDAKGQVFGQKGLFVADGSILSTPLGANPALTIAALAEWIAEQIVLAW